MTTTYDIDKPFAAIRGDHDMWTVQRYMGAGAKQEWVLVDSGLTQDVAEARAALMNGEPAPPHDPRAVAYSVTLTIIDRRPGRSRANVRTAMQNVLTPCTNDLDALGFVVGNVEIAEVLR